MQNEELPRVFNLSEHQNHRYNGCLLPMPADRTPPKPKKLSPRKKAQDMVTTVSKPVIKRRSKLKNSVAKAEEVIVNGANAVNNVLAKHKDLYADKYRAQGSNHFNNAKSDSNSLESITNVLSKLNKDCNMYANHRMRLTGGKYGDANHLRNAEASSSVNYPHAQHNHLSGEFDAKPYINNVANQKFNNFSAFGKKKLDEFRTKSEEYSSFMPDASAFKLVATGMPFDAPEKTESKFTDGRKFETAPEKSVPESVVSRSCENKLFLRAKRRKQNRSKWTMDGGTRHEALQRIRGCIELQENLQNDLYPLNLGETGYDKSDSDSADEYANTFQHHWFHSMSEIEFDDVKRNLRLNQLYSELRRQLCQIKQNKGQLPTLTDAFMKSVVEAARTRPADAMQCVETQEEQRTTTIEPLILLKKKCALETCKNVALPCMPTCIRHVLLCEKQMLFEQCRVRDSNSFQCDRPVLNIKYHYPVCSLHSKPDFVLPDFARGDIKYEDVRHKNASSSSAGTYKTDFDFAGAHAASISASSSSSSSSSKVDAATKKRNNVAGAAAAAAAAAAASKHQFARSQLAAERREREKKHVERRDNNKHPAVKGGDETRAPKLPTFAKPKQVAPATTTLLAAATTVAKEEPTMPPPPPPPSAVVPEVNPNLLRDWVSLSDTQLVDAKTLETTLQNEFVNGFDINASSIQSQIQDIINSESSLSTDMLMGSPELPNYIQVEEMIEEVEITDETLDSTELGNQELVHSEDLNAVLKQLPPEAFNELFSEFTLSEG